MNRSLRTCAASVAALALAAGPLLGCTPAEDPVQRSAPPPDTAPDPGMPSEDATGVALDRLELELTPIARGLEQPLWLTHAGDGSGRLFVLEQSGRVRVMRDDELVDGAFLDIRDRISSGGERGLLGLAFAPDYANSGRFFVNYTDRGGDTVVARFIAEDPASDAPALTGPETVFSVEQPYSNHNGGCIVFGPDGLLWVGMGDGGSGGDPQDRAQDPSSRLGKMLVVDVAGEAARVQPEIRYSGLRNPWRFSFDRETGDLWIADVGQNAAEEVNFVAADRTGEALNFGWNRWEGDEPFPRGADRTREGYEFPVVVYGHDEGRSVTGGYVYRGSRHPALTGTYLYADFAAGWVAGARNGEEPQTRRLLEGAGNPSSFGEDEDGELYLLDHGGTVYSIGARES